MTQTCFDDTVSNDSLPLDGLNTIFKKDGNCYEGGVMTYVSNIIQLH